MSRAIMTASHSDAPWLDIMIARQKLNIREFPGKASNNPLIGSRFEFVGWGAEWKREAITDETPWCAAEIGGALVEAGYPVPPKAVNLLARSYLSYGKTLAEPRRGAIGVLPRGKDTSKGHVVCVVSFDRETGMVRVIEGNKGNALVYGQYHASQFLKNGFRWPVKPTVKELREAGSTEIKQFDQAQVAAAVGATVTVATAATKVIEAAPTVPVEVISTTVMNTPWEAIAKITEHIGILQALGTAIVGAPWALPALLICYGLWRFGAIGKVQRVLRHMQGQPISAQVFIPEGEDPAEGLETEHADVEPDLSGDAVPA